MLRFPGFPGIGTWLLALALVAVFAAAAPAEDEGPGNLTFPEAMSRGGRAFEARRYEAAYLYYAYALSLRPGESDARDGAARSLYYAKRFPSREGLTAEEKRLPPVGPELRDQLVREMEKRFDTGADEPDREPAFPLEGPESGAEPGAGEGREWVPPEDRPRTPVEPEKTERPELVRPGLTSILGIPTRISLAPASHGRNHLFHTLVHIPAFEGVRTLDEAVWYVESGYEYCVGDLEEGRFGPGTTDFVLRFQGNAYHEGYLHLAHGLLDGFELRLRLTAGNLREGEGDVLLTDYSTSPETVYVAPYDRRADIGNLVLGAKWNFFRSLSDWPEDDPESGLTGLLDLKIPVARNPENFTSSGGVDLGFTLLSSIYLGKLVFFPFVGHASAGVTLPLGQRYFQTDVDLDPVFHFALGADLKFAGWGVLMAQVEGNTSAFTEFEPLQGMVLSTHVGLRLMIGHFFVETSVGFPLSGTASGLTFTLHFGLHFTGTEQQEEIDL